MSGFSPTSSHPSGGSSVALKQAFYFAGAANAPVSIPTGVDTAGPWVRVSGGTEDILNLTAPTHPVALVDGWYTFNGHILYGGASLAGKYMQCSAEADTDDWASGGNIFPVELSSHGSAVTGSLTVGVRVGFSEYLQAGQKIGWFVSHDAATALDFYMNGLLVCVTGITGQVIT